MNCEHDTWGERGCRSCGRRAEDVAGDLRVERAAHEQTKAALAVEREAHGCAIRLNNDLGTQIAALESELTEARQKSELTQNWLTREERRANAAEAELALAKPILESAEQYAIRHRIDRGVSHHNLINAAIAYARAKAETVTPTIERRRHAMNDEQKQATIKFAEVFEEVARRLRLLNPDPKIIAKTTETKDGG